MTIPMTAPQVLDREFLELRAKALELAAALDRLDRADGQVAGDPRMARMASALAVLAGSDPDRAERIQLIFSREYDEQWQTKFFGGGQRPR